MVLKNYKYSLFVRFWIQAYLDFCAATVLGLINFSMNNPSQYTNIALCIGLFTFEILTPILFFMFSYKNLNKIQHKERGFERLWSSFFYEFKNDQGLMSTQYYSIFFVRRLIYILNLTLLIDYSATQVTINSVLSFTTVFYLIKYRPYLEKVQQATNLATEIGIFLFVTIMAGNIFGLASSVQAKFELTMVVVAIAIMAVQMCGSLVIFGQTCYEIIKDGIQKTTGKNAKKLEQVNDPSGQTIHMDRDTEFYHRRITDNMTLVRSETRPTAVEEFILD
ncbi:unnamed protein product [Blepharisma stoltei]|uniref:Uncharacterized protein n=1 Tax=Blepharisma stoltei TaxID=1481888 RepID=A0AAU9K857_9CILI|nr:unnamed protein product [Blepharisma stoltei]